MYGIVGLGAATYSTGATLHLNGDTGDYNRNVSVISNSYVVQLFTSGVYQFRMWIWTNNVTTNQGLQLYYSSDNNTWTAGLSCINGIVSGGQSDTSFFYSFLVKTSAYSNALYYKWITLGSLSVSGTGTSSNFWNERIEIIQVE